MLAIGSCREIGVGRHQYFNDRPTSQEAFDDPERENVTSASVCRAKTGGISKGDFLMYHFSLSQEGRPIEPAVGSGGNGKASARYIQKRINSALLLQVACKRFCRQTQRARLYGLT